MQELIEQLELWVIEINSRKSSDSLRSRFSSLRREKQAIISKFEQLKFNLYDLLAVPNDAPEKKIKKSGQKFKRNLRTIWIK